MIEEEGMRQLSRIVLEGSAGSSDEEQATHREEGGYGELVEEIDRLLERDSPPEDRQSVP